MLKDKRNINLLRTLLIDSMFAILTYFAFFDGNGNESAQNAFQFLVVFCIVLYVAITFVYHITESKLTKDNVYKVKDSVNKRYSWLTTYGTLSVFIYGAIMASQSWYILATIYTVSGLFAYGFANSYVDKVKQLLEKEPVNEPN